MGDAQVFVGGQYEESCDSLIGVTHFRNMVVISVFAMRHYREVAPKSNPVREYVRFAEYSI